MAVQKWLNRSRCRLRCRLGLAEGSTCYMGAHWRNLANTTEPSVCSGDAALRQIILWPLVKNWNRSSEPNSSWIPLSTRNGASYQLGLASSSLVERTFCQRGLLVRQNRSRAPDSPLEITCFLDVQHININRETLCFVWIGLYDSVSAEKQVCDFQISSVPAILTCLRLFSWVQRIFLAKLLTALLMLF